MCQKFAVYQFDKTDLLGLLQRPLQWFVRVPLIGSSAALFIRLAFDMKAFSVDTLYHAAA